jgi:hypothetical protein
MNPYEYDPEQADSVNPEVARRFYDTATNMAIQPGAAPAAAPAPNARWMMGALAAQNNYKPVPEGAFLPDIGQPAISAGSSRISEGAPWANRLVTALTTPRQPEEGDDEVMYRTAGGPITKGDLNRGMDMAMSFSAGGLATKGVKAAPKAVAPGEVLNPGNIPGTIDVPVLGPSSPINAPYISNPQRVANPGIYKRPDVIAAEAAARVEPEHEALKQLFGVTRQDLYDISQQGRRQGNMETELWQPKRPGAPNEAALSVMNPANEQRILDTLGEARKHPGLEQGMVPWYVMDPMYQRMVQLVGPERAAKEYMDFNMSVTPFSAGSSVPSEINRGTAANMMRQRGEYDIFKQYGGIAVPKRGPDFPETLRDVKGMMGHLNQANPVERYFNTGSHGYGDDNVKINLYSGASGVPQTGFQTTGAVPDAHFTRAVGLPDARRNPNDFNEYMQGTEYRQIGPWYRNKIANPLGIEAVPAQALMWGTYGPQTGVKTKIGAGKLELMSKQMWERAKKLGIDPQDFRDQVLRGEQHSELEDDNRGMGSLASQSMYG